MDYDIKEELEEICRVCLEVGDGELVSIFQRVKEETVAFMITYCANIEVSELDSLPKQCCERCIEGMYIAYCMRKQCRESDIKLRSMLADDSLKKEYEPTFETIAIEEGVKEEEDHALKEDPAGVVEDVEVMSVYEEVTEQNDENEVAEGDSDFDVEYLEDDSSNDAKDLNPGNQCCICPLKFDTLDVLLEHSKQFHLENKTTDDKATPFECEICFQRYSSKTSLNKHLRSVGSETKPRQYKRKDRPANRCCGCKKDFQTKEELSCHSQIEHAPNRTEDVEGKKPIECSICFARYTNKKSLSHHKSRIYLERSFHCEICGKAFIRASTLRQHCKNIHEKKPCDDTGAPITFQCVKCGKTFSSQSSLHNHEKLHSDGKKYQCNICDKKFASKGGMTAHLKLHTTPNDSHPCNLCEKAFRTPELLKSHLYSHKNEKMYHCNICLVKFKTAYYLKFHARVHTGEKPYQCDVCQKTFGHYSGYKRHIQTHSSVKQFMCNHCGRTFSSRPNLLVHEKFHTGEKNSTCDICGKLFVHSKYMKKHRKIHFNEKNKRNREENESTLVEVG